MAYKYRAYVEIGLERCKSPSITSDHHDDLSLIFPSVPKSNPFHVLIRVNIPTRKKGLFHELERNV